jgi:drug/metabolite transporter (DMT)-like permease
VSRRGWVLFAIMCLVWGIPYLLIKVAVEEVAVPVVVFARTALGAAVLLLPALRSGQLAVLRRHWRPLVAFAALEMIGPWGLLSDAERYLPSSLAGLLIAAVPIIGVVVARITGGTERLSPRRWAGLLIGLAGVVVLAAPHLTGGSAWPVAEVLLVAIG